MSGPSGTRLRVTTLVAGVRWPIVLLPVALVAVGAALLWPRPAPAYPTYGVARLTALLQAHAGGVRGRLIAVHGYYHHGCPSCSWDAPPSLTEGRSWGGPSILVGLPDGMASTDEPAWVARWRALPFVGRLAPAPPAGPPEGFTTFVGAIGPLCTQATICDAPPFVLYVRK